MVSYLIDLAGCNTSTSADLRISHYASTCSYVKVRCRIVLHTVYRLKVVVAIGTFYSFDRMIFILSVQINQLLLMLSNVCVLNSRKTSSFDFGKSFFYTRYCGIMLKLLHKKNFLDLCKCLNIYRL